MNTIYKYGCVVASLLCVGLVVVIIYFFTHGYCIIHEPLFSVREGAAAHEEGVPTSHYETDLDALYRADTYGGATPEETVTLFLTLLEKGDTQEAAQYFLPESKKQAEIDLAAAKKGGHIQKIIDILSQRGGGTSLYEGAFQYNTKSDVAGEEYSIGLIRNPYTKKWKIEHF